MTKNFNDFMDYEMIPNGIVIYNFLQDTYLTVHDINALLATLKEAISDIATRRIFYQNKRLRFDEVVITPAGEFMTLRPLNAFTPQKALAMSLLNAFH